MKKSEWLAKYSRIEHGMKVVDVLMNGHKVVEVDTLPPADTSEFTMSEFHSKNHSPWGFTIGVSASALVGDKNNVLKIYLDEETGEGDIYLLNNVNINQPDVNKERYHVTNNPESYGYFDTVTEAFDRACRVLLAQRLGYWVESDLSRHFRNGFNLDVERAGVDMKYPDIEPFPPYEPK